MLLSDYNSQVRGLVHDLASVDWTDSELTGYINNARKRVALDAHCVRKLVTGLNLVAGTESYSYTGSVGGYVVTNPGSGYVTPVVTVGAAPAGGVNATANVPSGNVVGGTITGVFPVTWGSGYTAAPSVSITDSGGPGVGATATPIALLNVVDIVSASVLWPGTLMARTVNWSPFSEFQAWARGYRGSFGYPVEMTTIQEQALLYIGRIPDQSYGLELDSIFLPNPLVNQTDVDTQIIDPWADAVQWWAAYLAVVKLQNYPHAAYMKKEYKERLLEVVATKQTRRIRNIYMSSFRRRSQGR